MPDTNYVMKGKHIIYNPWVSNGDNSKRVVEEVPINSKEFMDSRVGGGV